MTFEERLSKMQTEIDAMRAELKAEAEPKQTGWVPKDGEGALVLYADGGIGEYMFGSDTSRRLLPQGRLAPNTEKGRSWLEAQRDRAASQWRSDNEEFEVNEEVWYFCPFTRITSVRKYSPHCRFYYPLHKTAESAETDRGWVTRLLEGRGWK